MKRNYVQFLKTPEGVIHAETKGLEAGWFEVVTNN